MALSCNMAVDENIELSLKNIHYLSRTPLSRAHVSCGQFVTTSVIFFKISPLCALSRELSCTSAVLALARDAS